MIRSFHIQIQERFLFYRDTMTGPTHSPWSCAILSRYDITFESLICVGLLP